MTMEVSFILSSDEVLTLMSLAPELTEAGQRFKDEALSDAKICDLSGLVDKNLAHRINDELDIDPVIRMISSAISRADKIEPQGDTWHIQSPWAALLCEKYPYHENHWKITPVKEART